MIPDCYWLLLKSKELSSEPDPDLDEHASNLSYIIYSDSRHWPYVVIEPTGASIN